MIINDEPEYLTRSDIARVLKISTKQAGRLMDRMPTLRVGRAHRRVLRSDFDAWRLRERQSAKEQAVVDAAMERAACYLRVVPVPRPGSVFRAAQALKKRRPEWGQTPAQTPALMSPNDTK